MRYPVLQAPRSPLLSSRDIFVAHKGTIVAVVRHLNFDGVFVLVKQPSARKSLFTNWPIVADDDCEVCHRFASFPLSYLCYRPDYAGLVP